MPAIVRIIEDGIATIPDASITENKLANDSVTAAKIANGAVGETELATNAVTQAKMADNSVGTAEIINANVTDAKLANNSVTTDKILNGAVTDVKLAVPKVDQAAVGNLLTANQASFENGTLDGWVQTSVTGGGNATTSAVASQDVALHGTWSMKGTILTTSTSTKTWMSTFGTRLSVPVTPGQTYTAQVSARTDAATLALGWNVATQVRMAYYASDGSYISTSLVEGAYVNLSDSVWRTLSATGVAPANAAYMAMQMISGGSSGSVAGAVVYFDCAGIWRGTGGDWAPPGTPITGTTPIDGSITTAKLADGAVTFAKSSGALAAAGLAFRPSASHYVGLEGTGTSTTSATQNVAWFVPMILHAGTIDRIAAEVTTGGAAGSVVRLGIYTANETSGRPDQLIVDAGTIDGTTVAIQEVTVSPAATIPYTGRYWIAVVAQGATCTLRTITGRALQPTVSTGLSFLQGSTAWMFTSLVTGATVTGALPSTAAASSPNSNTPRVAVRYATVV